MNKTLIALAALAATGAAFAQSTVTLYGRGEVSTVLGSKTSQTVNESRVITEGGQVLFSESESANVTGKPSFRIDDGNDHGDGSSRFGFRGVEDLGAGLKAVFQFEAGVDVDNGSDGNGGGNLFSRTAMVGLQGNFGGITFGRQLTPSFLVFSGSSAMGTMNGVADPVAGLNMTTVRESNSALYTSPSFAGFTGRVMVTAPEDRVSAYENYQDSSPYAEMVRAEIKPSTGVNLSLNYANGPLAAGFGYQTGKTAATIASSVTPGVFTQNGAEDAKNSVWVLGASYDFGMVKPFASYSSRKTNGSFNNTEVDGTDIYNNFGSNSAKRNVFTLGLTAPLGAGLLFAEYGTGKTKDVSNVETEVFNGVATAVNNLAGQTMSNKSTAYSIGYRYPLSKRTFVQAAYGSSKTTTNMTYVVPSQDPLFSDVRKSNTVAKTSGVALTLSHSF